MEIVEIALYILTGFIAAFIGIKLQLKKTGAGNCKMCKTCDYMLDYKKRKKKKKTEKEVCAKESAEENV